MRDKDIAKLDAATRRSQINSLTKSLNKLHTQILHGTTQLQVFSTQVFTDAKALSPANPGLVNQAFGGILSVQMLSVRAGLGIAPATPGQWSGQRSHRPHNGAGIFTSTKRQRVHFQADALAGASCWDERLRERFAASSSPLTACAVQRGPAQPQVDSRLDFGTSLMSPPGPCR
jgi:hypothetical protein